MAGVKLTKHTDTLPVRKSEQKKLIFSCRGHYSILLEIQYILQDPSPFPIGFTI